MVNLSFALATIGAFLEAGSVTTSQETANAIIACQVTRVDASYRNPQNPDELRTTGDRNHIAVGFTAVGSAVDINAIRLFDPSGVFGGNRVAEITWNSQTRGFVIKTVEGGEGAVSLVISGPEAGMSTFGAVVVRTNEAAVRSPLAYMFNGRCGLLPSRNLAVDFDSYVAAVSSSR